MLAAGGADPGGVGARGWGQPSGPQVRSQPARAACVPVGNRPDGLGVGGVDADGDKNARAQAHKANLVWFGLAWSSLV